MFENQSDKINMLGSINIIYTITNESIFHYEIGYFKCYIVVLFSGRKIIRFELLKTREKN